MAGAETVLRVEGLVRHFPLTKGVVFKKSIGAVKAVDGVSFELSKGETLGVVGESGCGKSTLGKLLVRLDKPTAGTAFYRDQDIFAAKGEELQQVPAQRADGVPGPVHLAGPPDDGR